MLESFGQEVPDPFHPSFSSRPSPWAEQACSQHGSWVPRRGQRERKWKRSISFFTFIYVCTYLFIYWSLHAGFQFPDQESNSCHLQQKHGALTTGLFRNSPSCPFLKHSITSTSSSTYTLPVTDLDGRSVTEFCNVLLNNQNTTTHSSSSSSNTIPSENLPELLVRMQNTPPLYLPTVCREFPFFKSTLLRQKYNIHTYYTYILNIIHIQ